MLCISQQTEDGISPQELHCLVERSPSTLEMSTKGHLTRLKEGDSPRELGRN